MADNTQTTTISGELDPTKPLVLEANNNKITTKMNFIDSTKPLSVNEAEKQTKNRLRPPTITSWQPGQSGNPKGRPLKNWAWKDLFEEALDEKDASGVPAKKIIAKKLVDLAKRGDLSAIKEIIDRMDGKAKQSTDLQTQGGMNVVICRYPHEPMVTDLTKRNFLE